MRERLRRFLRRAFRAGLSWLTPQRDYRQENYFLQERLERETAIRQALERVNNDDASERISELIEARNMAGTGPWRVSPGALAQTDKLISATLESLRTGTPALTLRETIAPGAVGAYSDIALALQNVEWRREINLSWLEFSRWGMQQLMLISRLYYIKNPLIQRGVNVSAQYVFGRGFRGRSSPDPDANDVLKDFFDRNQRVLGQVAITDLERRKYTDGNIFFVLFADRQDSGKTTIRTIDATEIMDIVTNPDDTDDPWFYHRVWTQKNFNQQTGAMATVGMEAWYPALGYLPTDRQPAIGGKPVMWDAPVYHRKCGAVSKWNFGCPLVYAALDWAKASKRFLEACATVKQSLATISMTFTTKGGQAALEAGKAQLGTTVGPSTNLWDQNPTPVNASIFGSGPGTKLEPFKITGAGGDPEEVRQFKLQVAMVFGLPETFFSDVKTGNLATAQSLDRPTELNFLEKQEAWREDLCVIARYVLDASMGAANGRLREALVRRKADLKVVCITEARRISKAGETVRYAVEAVSTNKIEVMATFPSIREGDQLQLAQALTEVMTLGNSQGQVVGIDEKAGVRKAYEIVGIENADELVEAQYPSTGPDAYDPVRKKEEPEPQPAVDVPVTKAAEAMNRVIRAARKLRLSA